MNDSPSRHNVRGCTSAVCRSAWLAQNLSISFSFARGAESGDGTRVGGEAKQHCDPFHPIQTHHANRESCCCVELGLILAAGRQLLTFTPTFRFFSSSFSSRSLILYCQSLHHHYTTVPHYLTRFLPTYLSLPHFSSVPSLLPSFLGIHPLTSAPSPVASRRTPLAHPPSVATQTSFSQSARYR